MYVFMYVSVCVCVCVCVWVWVWVCVRIHSICDITYYMYVSICNITDYILYITFICNMIHCTYMLYCIYIKCNITYYTYQNMPKALDEALGKGDGSDLSSKIKTVFFGRFSKVSAGSTLHEI